MINIQYSVCVTIFQLEYRVIHVCVNGSVLCNCGIEESLAACHDANSKLVMYFMVNTALYQLPGPI